RRARSGPVCYAHGVIRSVHIQNFRCLRDVRLELGPLTVLAGPNASGRGATLRALTPAFGWTQNEEWQREVGSRIVMGCDHAAGQSEGGEPQNQAARPYRHLRPQLDIQQLRKPNALARADGLLPDGSNPANLLKPLARQQQAA